MTPLIKYLLFEIIVNALKIYYENLLETVHSFIAAIFSFEVKKPPGIDFNQINEEIPAFCRSKLCISFSLSESNKEKVPSFQAAMK